MKETLLHIGLIPDGVRRWGKTNSKSLDESYFCMVNVLACFIDFFFNNDVRALSIYLLSKENLQRPEEELKSVFNAELYLLKSLIPPLCDKHCFDVIIAGRTNLLPAWVQKDVSSYFSENNRLRKLYLCLAYNPIDELLDSLSRDNLHNIDDVLTKLWVPQRLDVVIRTGGEYRLSNFLPLQSSYAELFFVPESINDVTEDTFKKCLNQYKSRNRRYGK